MTPDQKEEIHKLRLQGIGYKSIAKELLLAVETVKEYSATPKWPSRSAGTGLMCLQCKKTIM
jgi:uncharacterized protein YjcR